MKRQKVKIISEKYNVYMLSAMLFIGSITLLSIDINAQTARPTPTPPQDVTQVVSRDTDVSTNNQDVEDDEISDSDETENTVKVPRRNKSDSAKTEAEISKKQKQMMMYLDLLTKTEQRAASLRQQLFDLLEKQNSISSKLNQVENQLRPEAIESSTSLTGSLRPEDVRQQRKVSLELEKANLEAIMRQIDLNRGSLEENLRKADFLVERIRVKFEKAVDDALIEDEDY